MPLTKKKTDLESEIINRCVTAIKLHGYAGSRRRYRTRLDTLAIARVLRYLKDRFGIRE